MNLKEILEKEDYEELNNLREKLYIKQKMIVYDMDLNPVGEFMGDNFMDSLSKGGVYLLNIPSDLRQKIYDLKSNTKKGDYN